MSKNASLPNFKGNKGTKYRNIIFGLCSLLTPVPSYSNYISLSYYHSVTFDFPAVSKDCVQYAVIEKPVNAFISVLHKTVYVDASHYWPFDHSEEIVDVIGHKSVTVEGKVSTVLKTVINNGVQLDGSHSIIGLGNFLHECPGDFDLCQDGFTISVWLKHFLTMEEVSKHIFLSMGSNTAMEKGFKLVYDPAVQLQGMIYIHLFLYPILENQQELIQF